MPVTIRFVAAFFAAISLRAATLETVPLPSFFFYEENVGQADPEVRLLVRNGPERAYLTATSIHLFSSPVSSRAEVRFASVGSTPAIRGIEPWPGTVNRFEGAPATWRRNITAHRRVQFSGVYPGVDLVVGESAGQPTFTYSIQPGADPAGVILDCGGAAGRLSESGDWRVQAPFGAWDFRKPRAYQEASGIRTTVDVSYAVTATNQVRFQTGAYDRSRPLFVELELAGGQASRPETISVAIDSAGNSYLAGLVPSTVACRITTGGTLELCPDAFIAGIDPQGRSLFYTVLAGQVNDSASHLAPDAAGNLVVGGNTTSGDFPVTANAVQSTNRGPTGPIIRPVFMGDVFVASVSPRTGDLLYATYLGGPQGEALRDMAVAPDSSVTLATVTGAGFPTTPGSWLPECDPCLEASAVTRLDAGGSRLLFGTYFPGLPARVAVHSDGSAYVAGYTLSEAPTTEGALQTKLHGLSDAYVVRLRPDGSRPIFATYYGSEGNESADSIALDVNGDAWIQGSANTADFQRAPSFLIRISADGSRLVTSQLQTGVETVRISRDAAGRLLVYGNATAPNLPVSSNALLPGGCGNNSGHTYLRRLRADSSLESATYLSGAFTSLQPVAVDSEGRFLRLSSGIVERVDLDAPSVFSLGCITSAASRWNFSRVSPGTIMTLLGTRMGPEQGVAAAPVNGRFPTTLAGVRVLIGGIPAPLLFVRADQINAITPYGVTPGTKGDVVVEYQGNRATLANLDVVVADFALFSMDGSGFGQAAALNEDGSLNSAANPAPRGSIVVLYGTGVGATVPPSVDGALAPLDDIPKPALPVQVLFDRAFTDVYYAGPAPGAVNGLVQINMRLPENLTAQQSEITVNVVVAGSQFVSPATIAIR